MVYAYRGGFSESSLSWCMCIEEFLKAAYHGVCVSKRFSVKATYHLSSPVVEKDVSVFLLFDCA